MGRLAGRLALAALVITGRGLLLHAQSLTLLQNIATAAGTGVSASATPGSAQNSTLQTPGQPGFDAYGNVYFGDGSGHIYKIDRTGNLSIVAGDGSYCTSSTASCGDGGPATAAQVGDAYGLAVDRAGNIFFGDITDNRVRKITAATGVITTLVGTGTAGVLTSTTPVPASMATIYHPIGLALDAQDNLYFSDSSDNVIYKYFATGPYTGDVAVFVNTSNTAGYSPDGTAAASAEVNQALGVAVDAAGDLFLADQNNNVVRMVSASTGNISTVVGNTTAGYAGDGGAAISSELNGPRSLTFDNAGDLIIADSGNSVVRIVYAVNGSVTTASTIETLAGNGTACASPTSACGDGGLAYQAQFGSNPAGNGGSTLVGFNPAIGSTYISDYADYRLRHLLPSGSFSPTAVASSSTQTVALLVSGGSLTISSVSLPAGTSGGSEFTLGSVTGCATDGATANAAGSVCSLPVTFRPAYPGLRSASIRVVTSAGTYTFGVSGVGTGGQGVLSPAAIAALAGTGSAGYTASGAAASAEVSAPRHITVDSQGNVYFADTANHVIREVAASTGDIATIAGTAGTACSSSTGNCGDGGAATSALLNAPQAVALDSAGKLYIADTGDNRIRVVGPDGTISTLAGTGTAGYTGDGRLATQANLNAPADLALDGFGQLYIADTGNNVVRSIGAGGILIQTAAGTGTSCSSPTASCGDGTSALLANLNGPLGIAIDPQGNLVVADTGDNRIRLVIVAGGSISTTAGTGATGYSGDGAAAVSAKLDAPSAVAMDPAGNTYIADTGSNTIRVLESNTGTISTLAGTGTACAAPPGSCGNGAAAGAAALTSPGGIALDGAGDVYIADTSDNQVRAIHVGSAGLSFASTTAGSTSSDSPKTATLLNVGNAALTLFAPASGSNPSVTPGFDFALASSCPLLTSGSAAGSLAAGASCTLDVNFSPTTAGSFTGSLVEADNSLNNSAATQTVSLTGTATQAPSQTDLAVSPSPANDGQSVNLTVSVTGPAVVPTGTVTFYTGSTMLGTATLASGAATFPTGTLPTGSNMLRAVYGGDANYTGSAGTTTLTVNKGDSADTLTSSNASPAYGVGITLTDSIPAVNGVTPTGTVIFYNGATALGTVAVNASGQAALAIGTLQAGSNTVTATYGGDSHYAAVTSNAVTITVSQASITPTLTLSNASPAYGTSVTLTGTVPAQGSGAAPTGTATFFNGTTFIGTSSLSSAGVATLTTGSLPVGADSLTAKYSGDSNYSPAASGAVAAIVSKGNDTSSLSTSNASPNFGASVTLTDAISESGSALPTGTVTFYSGAAVLGTVAVSASGTAALSPSSLPVGADSLTAVYGGDSNYLPATSNAVAVMVSKAAGPDVLATSNASPSFGSIVSLSDSLPVVNGIEPSGTVTFYNGSAALATIRAASPATLAIATLPVGTLSITAVYSGDATYSQTRSNALVETVSKAGGSGSDILTSSNSTQVVGNAVTFIDIVPEEGGVEPTGSVTFLIGSTALGTVALEPYGQAALTLSNLPLGVANVTAAYSGDANYNPATSNFVLQTVVTPDFSIASSASPQSVNPGVVASFTVSLAGLVAAFNSPVTLTATGLPPGATATFSPASLTPGTGPTTATLTVATSPSQAALEPFAGARISYALLMLPLLGIKRIRRRLGGLPSVAVAFLLLGAAGALAGCAGGYSASAPQSFNITVTGTSGSLHHSTTVVLTVR